MLSRTRAVSSCRLRQRDPLDAKLLESRAFGDRDIWINAFSANESAVAPRVPAEIFKSAAVQALSQRVAERHFPTDWSFERARATTNASASLSDLTNSTVAAT